MSLNLLQRCIVSGCATLMGILGYAETTAYIDNFSVKAGSSYDLPVCVRSDSPYFAGFQCNVVLPEGVTARRINEEGDVDHNLTERTENFIISTSYYKDGSVLIIAFNLNNDPFVGSDGPIVTIPIDVAEDVEPGNYQIKLVECIPGFAKDGNITTEDCPDFTGTMTVKPARTWSINQLYAEIEPVAQGSNATLQVGVYSASEILDYSAEITLPEGVTVESVTYADQLTSVNFDNSYELNGNILKLNGECAYTGGKRPAPIPAEGGEYIFATIALNTSTLAAGDYNITVGNQSLSNYDEVIPEGSEYEGEYYPDAFTTILTIAEPVKIVIVDDGTEYTQTTDIEHATITYKRTFPKAAWQALYLPYDMAYEEWAEYGDLAQLNNVHQYDTDGDGKMDLTTLEFERITEGRIMPHVPYVFRPFEAGEVTFTSADRTLRAAPASEGHVWCSSTSLVYDIFGTYTTKTGLYDEGAYALNANGVFTLAMNSQQELKPHRIYLKISDKGTYVPASKPQQVHVSVDGEMTGIEDLIIMQNSDGEIYDMLGRKVINPSNGIYIQNGKKILIK